MTEQPYSSPTSTIRALGSFRETGSQVLFLCILTGVTLILYMIYAEWWVQKPIHPVVKVLPFVLFLGAIASWRKESQAAQNAHQGATAEEDIFSLVESALVPLGWSFRYNEKLTATWDIDIVALSPTGHTYIIDVKSHKGTKLVTDGSVYQRYGNKIYPMKKNPLKGVLAQAVNLKQRDNLRWVTPLLCFTEGWIEYETDTRNPRGVVVVSGRQVVESLLRLEG